MVYRLHGHQAASTSDQATRAQTPYGPPKSDESTDRRPSDEHPESGQLLRPIPDTRVHWFGLMPEDEVRLDHGT